MEKVIHQTWKNYEFNEFTNSVRSVFSDYEYKFWTDEDNLQLIRLKHPEFLEFYEELLPVEKADFIRHLYIYNYGGVYLDIDVKMNRLLVLEDAEVFLCDQTKEANEEKLEILVDPFFLAGESGCRFFYSVCQSMANGILHRILTTHSNNLYNKTLYKTGPYMLSKFYLLNKNKYRIKLLKDVFTTRRCESDIPKEQFHGIHMQMNSWLKEEDRRP